MMAGPDSGHSLASASVSFGKVNVEFVIDSARFACAYEAQCFSCGPQVVFLQSLCGTEKAIRKRSRVEARVCMSDFAGWLDQHGKLTGISPVDAHELSAGQPHCIAFCL